MMSFDEGIEIHKNDLDGRRRILVWLEEGTDKYDALITLPTMSELIKEVTKHYEHLISDEVL